MSPPASQHPTILSLFSRPRSLRDPDRLLPRCNWRWDHGCLSPSDVTHTRPVYPNGRSAPAALRSRAAATTRGVRIDINRGHPHQHAETEAEPAQTHEM
ncbi:hypothetical protein JTE90_014662 [Oedothorax gibbosus]|uniref:Uncharacterized protein n=1 Tax=Oedothorax gibbosus TaxID=931172 RepID=A0AAV6VB29_9ARAC|nr:hypothetical protein JTE90_014662 [Oedothorax gibbosus]